MIVIVTLPAVSGLLHYPENGQKDPRGLAQNAGIDRLDYTFSLFCAKTDTMQTTASKNKATASSSTVATDGQDDIRQRMNLSGVPEETLRNGSQPQRGPNEKEKLPPTRTTNRGQKLPRCISKEATTTCTLARLRHLSTRHRTKPTWQLFQPRPPRLPLLPKQLQHQPRFNPTLSRKMLQRMPLTMADTRNCPTLVPLAQNWYLIKNGPHGD